jgi:hypothetical protein
MVIEGSLWSQTAPTGMMGAVGENEPGQQPAGEWSAEQIRQFQEFQRFQAYLRFSESQGAPPPQQGGPNSGELAPAQPPRPAEPLLDAQLDTMRRQLERIERATNPPWWRRLLGSRPVRWATGLIILATIAAWGVPALINYYTTPQLSPAEARAQSSAAEHAPKTESNELPKSPNDAVSDVYLFAASNQPANACFLFDDATKRLFAAAFGATSCEAAISSITKQVTDANAYAVPDLTLLPSAQGNQASMTISSCRFAVSGGPRLGTFILTKVADGGWEITGYEPPQACPATTAPTS